MAVLKLPSGHDPKTVFDQVASEYESKWRLRWLAPLGFNNTFAMTVLRRSRARRKLSIDLRRGATARAMEDGSGYEFLQRPDGFTGLRSAYQPEGRWHTGDHGSRAALPGADVEAGGHGRRRAPPTGSFPRSTLRCWRTTGIISRRISARSWCGRTRWRANLGWRPRSTKLVGQVRQSDHAAAESRGGYECTGRSPTSPATFFARNSLVYEGFDRFLRARLCQPYWRESPMLASASCWRDSPGCDAACPEPRDSRCPTQAHLRG